MKRCKTFLLWWVLLTPMWGQSIFWGGGSVGAGAQWAATAQQRLLSHVSSYATGVAMAGSALEYGGFLYWIGRPLPLGVADTLSSAAMIVHRIRYDRETITLLGVANATGFIKIDLATVAGAKVARYRFRYTSGKIIFSLPIPDLSNGVYIIRWQTSTHTGTTMVPVVR